MDTRSTRTIVRDLLQPGMTAEEQALALFHWVRRVIYHSGPEEPLLHDFNLMVNGFGYGSCYMQTHPLSHLYQQLGFPCRNWLHNGHHMLEVQYDGGWHCFDPHMTFSVYNRARPRSIASVAELRADATLAEAAVAEGRAGPAFLICGDAPSWFAGDQGWVLDEPFLPHRGADAEFGGIHLRRGERYVRTWSAGRYYPPHAFLGEYGPYHTCGPDSDRRDPVNFPYWEPYAWQDRAAASHRHHGTGFLEYAPDLRSGAWQDAALRFINLTSDRDLSHAALHPEQAPMEAELIFAVHCPYLITGASLELDGRWEDPAAPVQVSVSTEWIGTSSERNWQEIATDGDTGNASCGAGLPPGEGPAAQPGEGPAPSRETIPSPGGSPPPRGDFAKSPPTRGSITGQLDLSAVVAGSLQGYWLRLRFPAGSSARSGLDGLKLRTDFQLNPYALPQLQPGRNRLFATAARAEGPWRFRLAWREGPEWSVPREYAQIVDGLAHEIALDVDGPPFPRMESLEFAVDSEGV